MNRDRTASILAALALALAVAALLFLSFWQDAYQGQISTKMPQIVYRGQTPMITPDGGTRIIEHSSSSHSSLIEENGLGVLWVLAIPAMLALAAFALSFWHSLAGTWLMFALASMMLAYAFVAMLSVGMFYVPVMLLMLIAAFAHARTRRAT